MADARAAYALNPAKVSKSKTQDFDECKKRYHFAHVQGIDTHPPEEVLTGIIGHEALLLLSSYCEELTDDLIRQGCLMVQVQGVGNSQAREKAEHLLIEAKDMISFKDTVGAEVSLELSLGHGFTLNGVLDRIDNDKKVARQHRRLRIIDYKFGRWVPPEQLRDDAQAQFYLALLKANARSFADPGEAAYIPISFERCWVQLGFVEGPIFWTPGIDVKARARALTHAREVAQEKEWKATVGTHCKRCEFIGSCKTVTDELELRRKGLDTMLPIESLTMPAQDLVNAAKFAKETHLLAKAKYEALEQHLRATIDFKGPIEMGHNKLVDFQVKRGWRAWAKANPKAVIDALSSQFGVLPDLAAITAVATNGDAIEAWIKRLPKDQRIVAHECIDLVIPRQTRQNLKESEGSDE